MRKIILATHNQGKVNELKQMLMGLEAEVYSLTDIDYLTEIPEAGTTFLENALIKARTIAKKYDALIIADDSGLSVDYLLGAPGVYSARYAGVNASDDENIDKLLRELKEVEPSQRGAQFICQLAVINENKDEYLFTGTCSGTILQERLGNAGFGYDPIFYTHYYNKSMAQLQPEQKNQISHRAAAFKKMIAKIGEI